MDWLELTRVRLLGFALAGAVAACGSDSSSSFGPMSGADGGDDAPVFSDDSGLGTTDAPAPCVNLQCKQVTCPSGGTTSLSGTVVTGTPAQYGPPDPVYNAIVYVPNSTPQPFAPGASCDKCGAPASGNPIAVALSGNDGKFVLENVPVGVDIPLVIQIGRWRRQVTVPKVDTACTDTPLTADQTRLPRTQAEGDIPLHAIASSTYDPEECILKKMGVDDSEFTAPSGSGRIHLYTSTGAHVTPETSSQNLWANLATLMKYDIVMFPCDSLPSNTNAYKAVVDYTAAGGRMFATDLSYPWIENAPAPFPTTVAWVPWTDNMPNPLPSKIDMTFPKGLALANWLQGMGATTTLGSIPLEETYYAIDSVNAPTSRWLYSESPASVQTFSFNTPVGVPDAQQCGRVAYSNFHIASGSGGTVAFPTECTSGPLTAQEKVMEFMLLDLASCVQNDTQPPVPPPK